MERSNAERAHEKQQTWEEVEHKEKVNMYCRYKVNF